MLDEIIIHGQNNTVTIQRPDPPNDRVFRFFLVLLGAIATGLIRWLL